jgi:hypothetical protein
MIKKNNQKKSNGYSSPWTMGSDPWMEIFQFLPNRVIQIYCKIKKIDKISKAASFFIYIVTYLFLLILVVFTIIG